MLGNCRFYLYARSLLLRNPAFGNIAIFPSFPEFMLIASFSGRFNLSSLDHRRRWGIDCSSVWVESMNHSFCSYGQLHRFPHWNIDRSYFSTLISYQAFFASHGNFRKMLPAFLNRMNWMMRLKGYTIYSKVVIFIINNNLRVSYFNLLLATWVNHCFIALLRWLISGVLS